jgi:hypothetical protein
MAPGYVNEVCGVNIYIKESSTRILISFALGSWREEDGLIVFACMSMVNGIDREIIKLQKPVFCHGENYV